MSPLEARHDQLSALFDQSLEAQRQYKAVDGHLKGLEKLGDAVRTKDVVKAMSQMVADGHVEGKMLAQIASTMPPQDGPSLAQWVAQRRQIFDQKMAQGAQIHEQLRSALSQTALQLMQSRIVGSGQDNPLPQGQGNPLTEGPPYAA